MRYWFLSDAGVPEARTTVNIVTETEKSIYEHIYKFKYYDDKIFTRFKEPGRVPNVNLIYQDEW